MLACPTSPSPSVLQLTFTQWALGSASYVTVYNSTIGSTSSDNSMVRFSTSSSMSGKTETVVSNVATIVYSQSGSQYAGWTLTWAYADDTLSICSSQVDDVIDWSTGTIMDHTSTTGSAATTNIDCTKTIQAPTGKRVKLDFSRFAETGSCTGRLYIYDGTATSNRLAYIYDTSTPPQPFIAESGTMTLRWTMTKCTYAYTGFEATWEFINNTDYGVCGDTVLTGDSGKGHWT